MDLTPEELQIKEALDKVATEAGLRYNPDGDVVKRVVKGLTKRKEKFGEAYCPCRLVTDNEEMNKKIVCPCEFHKAEIEEKGHCLCLLFVDDKYPEDKSDD